jgi:hypothetical protein
VDREKSARQQQQLHVGEHGLHDAIQASGDCSSKRTRSNSDMMRVDEEVGVMSLLLLDAHAWSADILAKLETGDGRLVYCGRRCFQIGVSGLRRSAPILFLTRLRLISCMSEVVVRFVDDSGCELHLIFLDGTTNLFLVISRKLVACKDIRRTKILVGEGHRSAWHIR